LAFASGARWQALVASINKDMTSTQMWTDGLTAAVFMTVFSEKGSRNNSVV